MHSKAITCDKRIDICRYWFVLLFISQKGCENWDSVAGLLVWRPIWILCHRWPLLVRISHCNTPTPPSEIYNVTSFILLKWPLVLHCFIVKWNKTSTKRPKSSDYECSLRLRESLSFLITVVFCFAKRFQFCLKMCHNFFGLCVEYLYSWSVL